MGELRPDDAKADEFHLHHSFTVLLSCAPSMGFALRQDDVKYLRQSRFKSGVIT
jgi:hypothetical protein